ncbi:MAG: DUF2267 domain-containing protein [Pseudomonadota bacterium]
MDALIAKIASSVGVDEETAKKVVSIILNFINKEGPSAEVKDLMAKLPGAEGYLAAPPGEVAGPSAAGGMLGGLGGGLGAMMGGGGAMAVMNELTAAGLGMGDVQTVAGDFLNFAREHAGDETVAQVVSQIPGLDQFL